MLGTRLQRARKAAGLSLRALGERIGLSHTAIQKYEDGNNVPDSATLLRLARALNVRTEYFFRQEEVKLETVEYRKRSTLPKKRLQAITHELLDLIERRLELESLFAPACTRAFEPIEGLPDRITRWDEIETAAESVRGAWQLGLDAIPSLVDVLEAWGIRVFMVDGDADQKFDGLAAHVQGKPVVVVGRHWPGDRQRFTLAHELGHLMLGGRLAEELDEERACNRFAGAFLFPRPAVFFTLGTHRTSIEMKELSLLKSEFGLSMAGILYRALDLGIISEAYRSRYARLFSMKGWRRVEPGPAYPSEEAQLFQHWVLRALAEDCIGESKAAELLSMSLLQLKEFRIVKDEHAALD